MFKLVIDTNVLVSALLKAQSKPALVLSLILNGYCTLCLSREIFTEYEEVLSRDKFAALDQAKVKELLALLKKQALWVEPKISVDAAGEEADNALLECGVEAKADFLVTGNIRHFPRRFSSLVIITPDRFLSLMAKVFTASV